MFSIPLAALVPIMNSLSNWTSLQSDWNEVRAWAEEKFSVFSFQYLIDQHRQRGEGLGRGEVEVVYCLKYSKGEGVGRGEGRH